MSKSKQRKVSWPCEPKVPSAPQKFQDRNIMKTSPLKEQFEPTDAVPVRQHQRMAGD